MYPVDDLFAAYAKSFEENREAEMTLPEYLEACRDDPMMFATATERLLAAIGEPEMVDTAKDARLGRIFMNRTIRVYPAFSEFFGMEETIERIVDFLRHSTQGLENRKQIMYLLGPVGGGKSSLAERLRALMELHPVYVLKAGDQLSPVFESPLGLFNPERVGPMLEDRFGIPQQRLTGLMSPWCVKRLDEFEGDIWRFRVAKLQPSRLRPVAVAKTEHGDEDNQDISFLGKFDIRKLEVHAQNDRDAHSYKTHHTSKRRRKVVRAAPSEPTRTWRTRFRDALCEELAKLTVRGTAKVVLISALVWLGLSDNPFQEQQPGVQASEHISLSHST